MLKNTAAAAIWFQTSSNSPTKSPMPTGIVCVASEFVRRSAKKNSFHDPRTMTST
jgi:hypothetical protein